MIDMAEKESNISQTSFIQKLLNESKENANSKEDPEVTRVKKEREAKAMKSQNEEAKRKWKGTISRFDIVWRENEYYVENELKPGFKFWNFLIDHQEKLSKFTVKIPDMLVVDEQVTLITQEKDGISGKLSLRFYHNFKSQLSKNHFFTNLIKLSYFSDLESESKWLSGDCGV